MAGQQTGTAGVELAASVPEPLTLADITARVAAHNLVVLGGFAPGPEDGLPADISTLLLLGPAEPGFWPHFTAQPEWHDGSPDPMDRWSRRVIGGMACDLGAKAYFPFGGPPYHPFYRWALKTGRVWDSPVRLLVHQDQGLFVSFRGALALRQTVDLPPPAPRVCDDCAKPCLTACPVAALGSGGYDVPGCHIFLNTAEGDACMSMGCAVRRACPVSQGYARMAEQSAYHMGQFHR